MNPGQAIIVIFWEFGWVYAGITCADHKAIILGTRVWEFAMAWERVNLGIRERSLARSFGNSRTLAEGYLGIRANARTYAENEPVN